MYIFVFAYIFMDVCTDHAESVAGFNVAGIGTLFDESVSRLGPVFG